jgi:hypothetical protein
MTEGRLGLPLAAIIRSGDNDVRIVGKSRDEELMELDFVSLLS